MSRDRRWWVLPAAWLGGVLLISLHGLWQAGRLMQAQTGYGFRDPYYVIAHWRYVAAWGAMFLGFAVVYAALGWFKAPYRASLGYAHLALAVLGTALVFLPGTVLALRPPVRYVDYAGAYGWMNQASSLGYVVGLVGLLVFVALLVEAGWRRFGRPHP